VQIFVAGPQNQRELMDDAEKIRVAEVMGVLGVPLVIHGAYVDYPWKLARGAVHNIRQEMRIAHQLGATGVIVHLGLGIAENLEEVLWSIIGKDPATRLQTRSETGHARPINCRLWLEINSARATQYTFETSAKLAALFQRIDAMDGLADAGLSIGLCIDTAHLFACGVALDTYDVADAWLRGLPQVPTMLHLNDSASVLGSGKDKHAGLCTGNLWGRYHPTTGDLPFEDSGLCRILAWAEDNRIMVILERDPMYVHADLDLIQSMGFFARAQ
jgi:endonuclease IV